MKQSIIDFLQTHLQGKPAIIGLSGGVDSAVVTVLLVQAVGPDRVYGLLLPSAQDAERLAKQLGIHIISRPINSIVQAIVQDQTVSQLNLGNVKARVRMTLLYLQANKVGGLVVGTGNKTELQLGYFTKYGDGGVDLLPLAGLYKTQVWQLAKELGIPDEIVTKIPSAGLWDGQTDEAELGITYPTADKILQAIEHHLDMSQFDPTLVQLVLKRMQQAQHKLQVALQP